MKLIKIITLHMIVLSLVLTGCDRTDLFNAVKPSDKAITAFSFASLGVSGTIDHGAYTIDVTVPYDTDVTSLTATFTTTGTSVKIGGLEQESGTTTNNFTSAVVYTITAENTSTQDYTVTVTITPPSTEKAITAYSFDVLGITAVIDEGAHTINATVPYDTDVTSLVATFTATGISVEAASAAQVSGTTSNDFSAAVVYTVTAEDSSTEDYTVTVTVTPPSTEKSITAFSFDTLGVTASIDGGAFTIDATVPYGTDVSSLAATFTTTGTSVEAAGVPQVSGTTAVDFSAAVIYTVTAEDSSTQNYTVTVTVSTGTPYEILKDSGSGSAVYGWRSGDGANVGAGQSVYIDTDLYLESFAIYLENSFGVDVPLRLHVRDDAGAPIQYFDLVVPASFAGGWVTWSGINMNIASDTTLIFTTYLVGGYDVNLYTNAISADMGTDDYTDGQRYSISDTYTDVQMESWANWETNNYDLYFHLQGVGP